MPRLIVPSIGGGAKRNTTLCEGDGAAIGVADSCPCARAANVRSKASLTTFIGRKIKRSTASQDLGKCYFAPRIRRERRSRFGDREFVRKGGRSARGGPSSAA